MTTERLAIYSAETRILTDLTFLAFQPTISSTQAKTGTYSYRHDLGKGAAGKAFETPQTAIRTGFWFYMANSAINDTTYLYHSGMSKTIGFGNSRLAVRFDLSGGLLSLERPLTGSANEVMATAPTPSQFSTTGTWFPVGITHKIHATDGFVSIFVAGDRVLHYEGDTRPAWFSVTRHYDDTTAYCLVAGGAGTSGAQGFTDAYVDDHFIDSIVGEMDGPVPARRFLMALPTTAGADAAWTPLSSTNVSNVDENPNDGDTSYNKALVADLRDTFNFSDITVPTDHRIVAVVPSVFAKRLDSEISNGVSLHAFDGLTYEDSADLTLAMTYDVPAFARFLLQPDGSAWDQASFNAMQFGYKSFGDF